MKKSGDDNEINGLPAGTPLEGAVFEIYAYKSGNLIDRFVSGSEGKAVSKPLPLGRYIVKEVQAPQWYKVSDKQLDIEVEFATQIIKQEFLNYSATRERFRLPISYGAMFCLLTRYALRELLREPTTRA
ncbi:hypothetical protein AGMMS49975_29130 [Clostridia bacterium]|nr:hypothetical protein AGMMS49975_29130 [Clostridia bacterium]